MRTILIAVSAVAVGSISIAEANAQACAKGTRASGTSTIQKMFAGPGTDGKGAAALHVDPITACNVTVIRIRSAVIRQALNCKQGLRVTAAGTIRPADMCTMARLNFDSRSTSAYCSSTVAGRDAR